MTVEQGKIARFQPLGAGHRTSRSRSSVIDFMMTFPTVKEWVEGIRHGNASAATKSNFTRGLFQYCKTLGTDPEALLQERESEVLAQDKKIRFHAEDRFRGFFKEFQGKKSVAYIAGTSVRSFYSYHRYPLQEKMMTYRRSGAMDYIPSSEEVLKMYLAVEQLNRATTKRDRAIVLLFAETGLRPQTIAKLRYKNIADEFEADKLPMAIHIGADNSKCGVESVSFILEDAKSALKEYLEERKAKGEVITSESLLFASFVDRDTPSPNNIVALMSKLGRLAELPNHGQYHFRGYNLRKRFQTIMEARKVPLNWVDLLMNHIPRGADASSYSRPSVEQLRSAYQSAAQDLIILPAFVKNLGQSPSLSIDYEALKRTLAYLPSSPEKMFERKRILTEIDQDSKLDVRAKYDKLFELVKEATIELRFGTESWTQDVVSAEEAENLIKSEGAEFISSLPNGRVVIRKKKKVEVNEAQVHDYFASIDQSGLGLTYKDLKSVELQSQNIK